jgi:Arc/MetJ-type ribon-helix-helix transcriptional regulator
MEFCLDMCDLSARKKGPAMASGSLHVRIDDELQDHIRRQTGEDGLYRNADDYIRDLIRRDIHNWDRLKHHLEPALRADETAFVEVSAEDVIRRNKIG